MHKRVPLFLEDFSDFTHRTDRSFFHRPYLLRNASKWEKILQFLLKSNNEYYFK